MNAKPKLSKYQIRHIEYVKNHVAKAIGTYEMISKNDNGIEIQFGKAKLTELQNAIKGIPKGNGDFAIFDHNDENILYIWWNLEK